MPKAISYGMGQYRYNKDYSYIQKYDIAHDRFFYKKTDYQDVVIPLPTISSGGTQVPLVQYGRTFYMRLTVPQSSQFTTTLKLKLCPGDPLIEDSDSLDTSRYQYIKQLVIPPTPDDDDDYSQVILYEVPKSEYTQEEIKVQLWNKNYDYVQNNGNNFSSYKAGNLYCVKIHDQEEYRYFWENATSPTNDNSINISDKESISRLPQTWKMRDTSSTTVTFDFVFSPKYELAEGYSFLVLEIDRTDGYHRTIQYIGDDKNTYYGTRLDKDKVDIELYHVSNLLQNGTSQIQSDVTSLTHIGVWGHPEQLLAINGEEIRIGQSGFYELNDFNINQLGVVVYDKNKDRFTIDYEYKIIS